MNKNRLMFMAILLVMLVGVLIALRIDYKSGVIDPEQAVEHLAIEYSPSEVELLSYKHTKLTNNAPWDLRIVVTIDGKEVSFYCYKSRTPKGETVLVCDE